MIEKIARKSVRGGVCPEPPTQKASADETQPTQTALVGEKKNVHQFMLIANNRGQVAGILLNKASQIERSLIRLVKQIPVALFAVILLVTMLFSGNVSAQTVEIKPLRLGEKVPAAIWQKKYPMIAEKGTVIDSLSLSDYKGKLILLDFWSCTCTSCFYKFPLLAELQKEFNSELKIVLVNTANTKDTKEQILARVSGKRTASIFTALPTIYNDVTLTSLFPHRFIPHYLWLDDNGELIAITGSELLGRETTITILKYLAAQRAKRQNKP